MKQLTHKQLMNNLEVITDRVRDRARAVKVLARADCIEAALNFAFAVCKEADEIKEVIMNYDLKEV